MKTNLLLLLVFGSFIGFSQSKMEKRNPQYQIDYSSELTNPNSRITISKYNSPELKEFALVLSTEIESCEQSEGLTLTLLSGETLSFKSSEITCEKLANGKNKLTSRLPLTPELYSKLSQTEIITFQIGLIEVFVHFKENNENLKTLFKVAEQY